MKNLKIFKQKIVNKIRRSHQCIHCGNLGKKGSTMLNTTYSYDKRLVSTYSHIGCSRVIPKGTKLYKDDILIAETIKNFRVGYKPNFDDFNWVVEAGDHAFKCYELTWKYNDELIYIQPYFYANNKRLEHNSILL